MEESNGAQPDRDSVQLDPFPEGLSAGSTVLVAGTVDPATYAIGLRALSQLGSDGDTALVVTTTESADRTTNRYDEIRPDSGGAALGLVDTTSERKSVSALYGEHPVVYVPAPNDLERLVIGLSDLTSDRPPASGTRHLLVRSLTPLLDNASTDAVCTILDRIGGLRMGSGLTLFGIDYTAHSEEVMTTLSEHVDGVLWITEGSGTLKFEFSRTGGRYVRPVEDGGPRD